MKHARAVAAYCRRLGRTQVNLIPYNPGSAPITRAPSPEETALFESWLLEEGVQTALRATRGSTIMAGCGQLDACLAAHLFIEGVRHLQQHAGAVARVDFAATGPAVVQVLQYLDRLLEDAVRLVTLEVDDEPLAAGVVLVARVVKTLFGGRAKLHRLVLMGAVDRSRRSGNRLLCAHRRPCLWFSGVAQGQGVAAARREPARLNLSTVVDTSLI